MLDDATLLRRLGITSLRTLSSLMNRVHEGTDTAEGALLEVARRIARMDRPKRVSLRNPAAVVSVLRDAPLYGCERLWVLPLDPHSALIGDPIMVSLGDVDGTDAGPRAVFRAALGAGATTCIVAHNHPSGDATPSAADCAVTVRLVAAGRAIDVPLMDHVVIGAGGSFVSLRAQDPSLFR